MQIVQPIRDKNKIDQIKSILKLRNYRDYVLFIFGINSGLRISDLLKLRVSDVKDKSHIQIKEQKTGKFKRFLINDTIKNALKKYIDTLNDYEYLFRSKNSLQAITRIQAYRIINNAAKQAGINDQIGTHTLRKTFGYWHYQTYKDVALLQNIFNHSSPAITLRYIGITDDLKDQSIQNLAL